MTYRKLWIAKRYIQQDKYLQAKRVLYPAAKSGIAEAQALLGYLYFTQDEDMSRKECHGWLVKAAGQRHPEALAMLASMVFRRGIITTFAQSPSKLRLKRLAAERGSAQAQRDLACSHIWGESVRKDPKLALYWYTRAAEQGHGEAQLDLGHMWMDGDAGEQDTGKAIYWYKRCAERDAAAALAEDAAEMLYHIYSDEKLEEYYDKAAAAYWQERHEHLSQVEWRDDDWPYR